MKKYVCLIGIGGIVVAGLLASGFGDFGDKTKDGSNTNGLKEVPTEMAELKIDGTTAHEMLSTIVEFPLLNDPTGMLTILDSHYQIPVEGVSCEWQKGLMVVTGSENVIRLIKRAISLYNTPNQVEINALLVGFDLKEISAHPEFRAKGFLSQESILELWRTGKGTLLDFQKVVTLNGVNAQVEQVDELIYPTEFLFSNPEELDDEGGKEGIRPPATIPGAFETRELGAILNVTPQVGNDMKTINLTLIPEHAELKDSALENGKSKAEPSSNPVESMLNQPRILSNNVTTSIIIESGKPLVLSCGRHPTKSRIDATIISGRLIMTDGSPFEPPSWGKPSRK